jgi:hypothetical protein
MSNNEIDNLMCSEEVKDLLEALDYSDWRDCKVYGWFEPEDYNFKGILYTCQPSYFGAAHGGGGFEIAVGVQTGTEPEEYKSASIILYNDGSVDGPNNIKWVREALIKILAGEWAL